MIEFLSKFEIRSIKIARVNSSDCQGDCQGPVHL